MEDDERRKTNDEDKEARVTSRKGDDFGRARTLCYSQELIRRSLLGDGLLTNSIYCVVLSGNWFALRI